MILRLALALALVLPARAALFDFPTANRALLDGRPEDFFMYVDRDFEGQKSQPWEGGQFGFVRGPVRTAEGIACLTLHEGIDIKPLRRDASGNPQDDVCAAAAGRVVHVSPEAGASNYGKYVVIEHQIEGSSFYTLYAHLSSVNVAPGQTVRQGEPLGRLGFTGSGLDRARAHVHFEIAVLLSRNFEAWHLANFPGSPNKHGLFNGLNLSGTDPSAVLKAAASDPGFRLASHVRSLDPVFKITLPNSPNLTFLRDYPWLVPAGEIANPPSWTISFTGTGFPIGAVASQKPVAGPEVAWIKETREPYSRITRGLVGGSAGSPKLTSAGYRFASLLMAPPSPAATR